MKKSLRSIVLILALLFAFALLAGCAGSDVQDNNNNGNNNGTNTGNEQNPTDQNKGDEQNPTDSDAEGDMPEIVYDLFGTTLNVYAPEGAEYRLDDGTWQTSGNYTLSRGQTYSLSMRWEGETDAVTEEISVSEKKVMDVYLIGGQSNALGISQIPQLLDENDRALMAPNDNVRIYAAGETGSNYSGNVNTWTTVRGGLGLTADHFGPEIGIADTLDDYYPADSDGEASVAIIKYTWGGTNLFYRWLPPTSYKENIGWINELASYSQLDGEYVGDLYANFVNTVRTQISALEEEGYQTRIRGMMWMQGEADAGIWNEMTCYERNLENLINDLRDALEAPDMPFVIGEINTKLDSFANDIRAIQKRVADKMENAYFISTTDLEMGLWDWYHFYAPDMITLGRRFGAALLSAARNIPIASGQSLSYTVNEGSAFSLPQMDSLNTADGNTRLAYIEWDTPAASDLVAGESFTLNGKAIWNGRSTPVTANITVEKGVTLDGVMDEAIWQDYKLFDLGDNKTTFRTFYTDEGIYVGAYVKDTEIVNNIATTNFDGDMRTFADNLGLFFETTGTESTARTTGQTLVWLCPNDILRIYQTDANASWAAGNMYLSQAQMNVSRAVKVYGTPNLLYPEDEGYAMELFIPFSTLGITADEIASLRWNIEVSEATQSNTYSYKNLTSNTLLNFDNTSNENYVPYLNYAVAPDVE